MWRLQGTPDDFRANPYLWIQMVHEEDHKAVEEQAAQLEGNIELDRTDGATFHVRFKSTPDKVRV